MPSLRFLSTGTELVSKNKKRASFSQDVEPDDESDNDNDDFGSSEGDEEDDAEGALEKLDPPFLGDVEEDLAEEFEEKVSTKMSAKPKQQSKLKERSSSSTMQVVHPVHMYPWYDANEQHKLTVDVHLLSGTTSRQIRAKVRSGGLFLDLEWDIPDSFLEKGRLVGIDQSHHKAIAFAQAVRQLKEENGCTDYKPTITLKQAIKLPFQVESEFCDDDVASGCEIIHMEHESQDHVNFGIGYLVFSVELVSITKPLKKAMFLPSIRHVQSPLKQQQHQEQQQHKEQQQQGQQQHQGRQQMDIGNAAAHVHDE